jgi:predicted GIY-YIG superfamily endonuclease
MYILFSAIKNSYYIGFTGDDLDERIRKHNTNHKGYTGHHQGWELKYYETFNSKIEAPPPRFVTHETEKKKSEANISFREDTNRGGGNVMKSSG